MGMRVPVWAYSTMCRSVAQAQELRIWPSAAFSAPDSPSRGGSHAAGSRAWEPALLGLSAKTVSLAPRRWFRYNMIMHTVAVQYVDDLLLMDGR